MPLWGCFDRLLEEVTKAIEHFHVRLADHEDASLVVASRQSSLQSVGDWCHRGHVGVHAFAVLLGFVRHVDHAPLVEHALQVETLLLFLCERFAAPILEVDTQGCLVSPRHVVVLGDDHWLAFVGDDGVAFVVVAVDFPTDFDLAVELDLAFVIRLLSSEVDDAVAARCVDASRYWCECWACVFYEKVCHFVSLKMSWNDLKSCCV